MQPVPDTAVDLYDEVELLQVALADIEKWLAEGKLKAPPVTTYALQDAGDAHRDIESGKTIGKLVLIP